MNEEELFWPSLYSRLVPDKYYGDEASGRPRPDASADASRFFIDFPTLCQHIKIDLEELFTATSLEASLLAVELLSLEEDRDDISNIDQFKDQFPFEPYPRVQASAINFGLPSIIGRHIYDLTKSTLKTRIEGAIRAFESRLDPDSIKVAFSSPSVSEGDEGSISTMIDAHEPVNFQVSARVRTTGKPLTLYIRSIWDLEKVRSEVKVSR